MGEVLTYQGDDERNQVSFTATTVANTPWVVVRDAAGTLEARTGCEPLGGAEVRCRLRRRSPLTTINLAGGDDTLRIAFPAGVTRVDAGAGADVVDVTQLADASVDGGEGNDVLRGGPKGDVAPSDPEEAVQLDGGDGDDLLYGGDAGSSLAGGPGRDRLRGGRGPDSLHVDVDDSDVDARGGNDDITSEYDYEAEEWADLPDALACGDGHDSVSPVLYGYRPDTRPLLRHDCEQMVNFRARPVAITASAMTFRVRCQRGEFEYADHRCRGRLRLRWNGTPIASRRFSALNEGAVRLRFPLTGALRRALSQRAIIDLEMIDYEFWFSDRDDSDARGNLYWRIQLPRRR